MINHIGQAGITILPGLGEVGILSRLPFTIIINQRRNHGGRNRIFNRQDNG
jgi:hypothetical protein